MKNDPINITDMEKSITQEHGAQRPPQVAVSWSFGMPSYTVCVDVEEVPCDDADAPAEFRWTCIRLAEGRLSYDTLVAALVRTRYPDDAMTAIINNHLLDGNDADIAAEWEEMQAWRREAKTLAKQILTNHDNGDE